MNRRAIAAALTVLVVVLAPLAMAEEGQAPAPVPPVAPPPPPPQPPEPPKLQILLNDASTTGTVSESVAKLSLSLAFEALSDKPQEMLLLPADVSVTEFAFGGRRARYGQIARGLEGYLLRTSDDGEYSLELQYVVRVEKNEKTRSLTLPLIPAAKARTQLTLPEPSVAVTLSPAASFETQAAAAGTLLTIYGAADKKVTVTWTPKVEPKKVEPVVFADQNARVTVGRGVLRVDSIIDYTILQGKVKELSVGLPAEATLLSVKGPGLRSWDVAAQGGERTLRIQLLEEVGEGFPLELQIEQPMGPAAVGQASAFAVPAVAVRDVERETGAVGILVWKGLKVEPVKTEGVTQVDVREMPKSFQDAKEPVHLAYRYLQRPFAIEAKVSEVEAKVSADVLTAVRVSPESLRSSSKISYLIKDAGIFRLRIGLGKSVKLVDLQGENINNWEREADALVVDLRSKAEGPYALSLETEQAIAPDETRMTVEPVELLDVARQRGYLAISAYPGIKIEPVGPKDIMQVDVSDLPTDQQGQKADLAFRYLKPRFELGLAISKVEAEVGASIYTVIKVDEKSLEATALLSYDIRKAGIFQLQIALPKGFRLLGCEGESIDDWKVTGDALTVSLKQKTTGKYTLQLTGKQDVSDLATVPIPTFKAVGAEKETGVLVVRADESLRVKTGKTEGLAEIDVKEAQGELPAALQKEAQKGNVLLAYRYFAQGWSGTLAGEPIEPYVTADTFTFLSLGEAIVQAAVSIRYDILYAGVQTFSIQLPETAANVDFKGAEIKHREEDKANHTWTITLQAKRKGRYDLFVTYEQKVGGQEIDLEYEGATVLDVKRETGYQVKRETGYLAVAARSDLELAAGPKLAGLTPIDPQEIPADYKAGITAPLLLAFRYLKHPYVLHATAIKHDPADVLVAIIEGCFLSTTLTEDGNLITDVTCRLRNTREQNLAIALPEDADLWHVFVDGRRAIPVRSQEGGTTWTKVPIAGVGDGMQPFIVQLRYGRKIEPLAGHGVLELDFPRMAIPAMRLGWQISLPEKYRLVSHSGSLRPIRYLDNELGALAQIQTPTAAAPRPEQAAGPAQGPVYENYNAQIQDNLTQESGKVVQGRAQGQRSIFTGSRPQTANTYTFQSLIAMRDTGTIRSTYLRSSVDAVVQGALVVVTAAVVLAFFTLFRRLGWAWRIGVVLALALIVLGVRTLAEDSYHQHLTDVLWTLVGASIVAAVWEMAKAIGTRQRREQRAPALAEPKTA